MQRLIPATAVLCVLRLAYGICLAIVPLAAQAQPAPGDLFREYYFTKVTNDAGGAIRVGGKKGVSYPDRGSDFDYVNAWIDFPHSLDLLEATRAELVVEKILSHNGTHGLAIQWNEGQWIDLPAPAAIPEPRRDHYHHACLTVAIPLDRLRADEPVNRFRLRVSPEQDWGWPQHLIYGVHLRVYYDTDAKDHVRGKVVTPGVGGVIGRRVQLAVDIDAPLRRVNRVEYVAKYEDVNWEGDGIFRQWHSFYYHGNLTHHLGTSDVWPYALTWDTSWVPDQVEPIEVAARIVDDTDLTYMTAAAAPLQLKRPGFSVELCKPTDVPDNWVTRNKAYEQTVTINGDVAKATAARLMWSSWSPGYMNGLFLNGEKVIDAEGPRYRYFDHRVPVTDLTLLRPGSNTIGTGKTPLHDGKMVHGMEVNWPGIQLLIQYETE